MDFLVDLIQQYGYYIVFVGTLLEGETIVALAGFAAHQGHLHLVPIILIAILGAVIGDQCFFYFGRRKGREMLLKHPEWNCRVDKVHTWMERYRDWLMFGSRFLYGFRAVTPVVLGMSNVSWLRYFIFDLLGALVWAPFFVFGGYIFGEAVTRFLGNVKKFEGTIVAIIICTALIVQLFTWWRRRKSKTEGQQGDSCRGL